MIGAPKRFYIYMKHLTEPVNVLFRVQDAEILKKNKKKNQ